nr:immunoglobulin heavy chain junction region [Macaca mulatta]MOV38244.1 immunoglobulin heavy chain junction region [Macaca mulatta]MOV38291.1 immunoglobulin heavy chain junction region [Macaca mulatta]MOV38415.1 immunoglobulin heavy chain junction region [Macaca mulatta]MOV38772.1 immunoglobulin heavy chain junction region [Macaca mulatta]
CARDEYGSGFDFW